MFVKNSEILTELYISDDYLKIERSSSQGNQKKYYKDGKYYKLNALGYENISEFLVSLVLKHSNVNNYVQYHLCKVNNVSACWSEDFLQEHESFYTFDHIYKIAHFHSLSDDIMKFDSVEKRIKYTISFFKDYLDVDCSDYIAINLALDMLVLNNDRHFNNLGFVHDSIEDIYYPAPIFDNGAALLSNFEMFPPFDDMEELIDRVSGKPFSGSLERQFMALENKLKINYSELMTELDDFKECRAKTVLLYQLRRYEKLFNERNKGVQNNIMKHTLMEQAQLLLNELSEITEIPLDSISKDDETILALFQHGTEVNRNVGLSMIPMFESGFARRVVAALQPESYEDVRKMRAFVNDGGEWAFTTLDMLEKGVITLKTVLADQTDLKEFAEANGIHADDMKSMVENRHIMTRETAELFADITWKLAFFKIHCEELYYIHYKTMMADFYPDVR